MSILWWNYLHSKEISEFCEYYLHFVEISMFRDIICISWIYMYYVDTIRISWKHLCSVDIIIFFTSNRPRIQSIERLWSSNKRNIILPIFDRFLSVLDRILPSQIDRNVNQFWSVIVRNVYIFCTMKSVPAAYQIKALIIIYPTVLSYVMVYIVSIKCIPRLVNQCK